MHIFQLPVRDRNIKDMVCKEHNKSCVAPRDDPESFCHYSPPYSVSLKLRELLLWFKLTICLNMLPNQGLNY